MYIKLPRDKRTLDKWGDYWDGRGEYKDRRRKMEVRSLIEGYVNLPSSVFYLPSSVFSPKS